jgi:hypothetical protein
VFSHPAVFSLFARAGSNSELQVEYEQLYQLELRIIEDIDNELKLN